MTSSISEVSSPVFSPDCLKGRVAVVTGAFGGLGVAIAQQLSDMGARVAMVDRVVAADTLLPQGAIALACDITLPDAINRMAEAVKDQLGRCDILVNNAGRTALTPLEDISLEEWDGVFDVNVKGALLCAQALVPMMFSQGWGRIVNIASIGNQTPTRGGAYGASKSAMCGLTRQMAVAWGEKGIRANSVSPGMVRTPLSEPYYKDPERAAARLAALPVGHFGEPEDIAMAVAFLSTDAARYLTGQDIVVDGGFLPGRLYSTQRAAQPKG